MYSTEDSSIMKLMLHNISCVTPTETTKSFFLLHCSKTHLFSPSLSAGFCSLLLTREASDSGVKETSEQGSGCREFHSLSHGYTQAYSCHHGTMAFTMEHKRGNHLKWGPHRRQSCTQGNRTAEVSHFSHQITSAVTDSKGSMLKGLLPTERERRWFYKPNIMFSFIKNLGTGPELAAYIQCDLSGTFISLQSLHINL